MACIICKSDVYLCMIESFTFFIGWNTMITAYPRLLQDLINRSAYVVYINDWFEE